MKEDSFLRRLYKSFGPGFITGAADDDPSGIGTYSQTGAQFGFSQLWTAPFSFPFMLAVQEMCGRIGLVTGQGLASVIKTHYSKKVLWAAVIVLLITNTINIGADLGAMAAALQLIVPGSFIFLLLTITSFMLVVEIIVPYPTYARFLKYLAISLLAYVATALLIKQDWSHVAYATLVPHIELSKSYLLNIAAILGTTISPYLFFWQADEEVEEEIATHKVKDMNTGAPLVQKSDITRMRWSTTMGMFFSQLIMFFIVLTVGATLYTNGIHTIETAQDAALALRPFAGDLAFFLFAIGIVGTGLLAVPVLAGSAAYALAETFGWEEGLGKKYSQAPGFYGIIIVATLVGLLVNLSPIGPMQMLYYSAVLNGLLAPPLLILILLISNNKKILGTHTNGRLSNVLGIAITLIMGAVAVALLVSFLG